MKPVVIDLLCTPREEVNEIVQQCVSLDVEQEAARCLWDAVWFRVANQVCHPPSRWEPYS